MLVMFYILTNIIVASPQHENVTVKFSKMSPHLNQNLYLRFVDKSTLKETDRTIVLISAAIFSVTACC
jgi:oligoribonuclease (3'-5' exoribonuclease)